MREHRGQRFYTAADVNLEQVHRAMTEAGRRTEALPFDQLGMPAAIRRARIQADASRRAAAARPAHDYGPHDPGDPLGRFEPVRYKVRGLWITTPVDDLIGQQRARINTIAHEQALARKATA